VKSPYHRVRERACLPDHPITPVPQEPQGLGPRKAALEALERVRAGEPLDLALDVVLEPLEGPDRRLAHELAAGVLRTAAVLDREIAPHVSRGLDGVPWPVRNLLRLGTYQLAALDRIPPHAAVSTSVDLTRTVGYPSSAGFVNAILRRVAEHPPQIVPGRGSHPGWMVSRWTGRFGPQETAKLLAWNDTRPKLIIQSARWSEQRLRDAWTEAGIAVEEAPFGAGLMPAESRPADLPGYDEGGFIVQDAAQRLVVDFFGLPMGATVFDACAAPGGKTILLGRDARLVIAGDSRLDRMARLRENIRRAGSGREFAIASDAGWPPVRQVDAVVLDVPCLGTGVLARNPDARWRKPSSLGRLVAQASSFLDAAASRVSQGGLLCFSTCSLEPEENEEQIEAFLERDGRFHREPGQGPDVALTDRGDLILLPQRHGTDGAYAARLRRGRS